MYSTSTTETEKVTIFGGDYAGHSATFSSIDGALIPVPNHYVPEAMVEWGQVPNGLECIVSEDLVEAENENDNDAKQVWERNVVTIMPEVGCGLDNLDDTMKKESAIHSNHIFIERCEGTGTGGGCHCISDGCQATSGMYIHGAGR